jgi:mono/diheme cytochrome c family protein
MRRRALAACALALAGCGPGWLWPASMEQQASVVPFAEARPVPAGAMPVERIETVFDRDDVEDLKPSRPFDAAAEERGKALFARYCVPCHGKEAKGDGPVSAKFPPAPNLRYAAICKRTDGLLYGTLTAGGKAMPPMREGTTSRDRWDLVAYVRSMQRGGCLEPAAAETQGAAQPGTAPQGTAPPGGTSPAAPEGAAR